jgi:Zn-dependent protease with chaperone function
LVEGTLYDGVTAHSHGMRVEFLGDALRLSHESGWSDEVPASALKRLDSGPAGVRLGRCDREGWRLVLPAEADVEVTRLLGRQERYGTWIDRIGLARAAAGFAVVAAAVVAIGYTAPQWIAPHVPYRWEQNLGAALVGDFGDLRCRSAEGQRALEALVERIAPGATRGENPIRVAALDVSMFNAAALPGGHIVVFKPVLTETENMDEVAGILAHEIAHVRRRHVTEALVRELGIGALIRLFAGDVGANAEQLVALSYTREAEAEADADAIAMLNRAHISPLATAQLFERLSAEGREDSVVTAEFLSSHPLSKRRAQRFAEAAKGRSGYRPALSRDQQDALFNICWAGPDRRAAQQAR